MLNDWLISVSQRHGLVNMFETLSRLRNLLHYVVFFLFLGRRTQDSVKLLTDPQKVEI